jgi:hypothetical protein
MVKIEQKNASTPLNLAYGNNHFEHTEFYLEITNIPIHIHNDDPKKKTIFHNTNINNINKTYNINKKRFSWNLD